MNLNNHNKKGAVEMSLNLIIMLVIGLTVLGLIIAFVTNFLGDAGDSLTGSLTADDQTKLDEVKRKTGNFLISPANLVIPRGDKAKLYMKVENPFSTDIGTPINLGDSSSTEKLKYSISGTSNDPDGISIISPPISLSASEVEAIPMTITVDETVGSGDYFVSFDIEINDGTNTKKYDSIITITVE